MTEPSGLDHHPLHAPSSSEARLAPPQVRGRVGAQLEWRQVLAVGLFALAAVVAALGWYGVSGKADAAEQLPYLASGAVGAAILVALGVTSLLSFEHARDRMVLEQVLRDLTDLRERSDRVEAALAASTTSANGSAPQETRARRSRAKAGSS